MAYVSARYAPPPPELTQQEDGGKNVIAIDENGAEWHLTEDSQEGDWLRYVEAGGTIDPAPPPPFNPPPEIIAPERDYGAEIDALNARVTALEAQVMALNDAVDI